MQLADHHFFEDFLGAGVLSHIDAVHLFPGIFVQIKQLEYIASRIPN